MMHSVFLASTLQILPPLYLPGMLRFLACVLAGIVALVLSYGLVRLIWRIRWRSQTVTRYIHLNNQGNLRSDLNLGAVSPARNLKFSYLLDGAVLPVRKCAGTPAQAASPAQPAPVQQQQPAAAPAATAANAPAAPAPSKSQAKDTANAAGAAVATAQETAGKVSGLAAVFIDIVGTLGSLIPGSTGEALKQKSLEMQRSKALIKSKGMAPAMKIKQMEHLKESVGDLGDEVGKKKPAGAAPAPAGQGDTQAAAVTAARGGGPAAASRVQPAQPIQPPLPPAPPQVPEMPCPEYIQLPTIPPGSSLRLALRVSPSNLYYQGESYFWVFTRPQSATDLLPAEAMQPQKTVQSITYAGIPLAFHMLSILLSFAAVIANGVWFYYFVGWLTSSFN